MRERLAVGQLLPSEKTLVEEKVVKASSGNVWTEI